MVDYKEIERIKGQRLANNICNANVDYLLSAIAALREQLAEVTSERDALAQGIADAAIKVGIIDGSIPLTGPQLLMLCKDLSK